jgi:hypothetical protein
MGCKQRGIGSTRTLGFLTLCAMLAACGGHSSPAEPAADSLIIQSLSPPEGTGLSKAAPFLIHAVLQYHLADGPEGDIRVDLLRADGSPLYQPKIPIPVIDFPFPLFQKDGTFKFDDSGQIPADAGVAMLMRFRLYPKGGGPSTVEVIARYAVTQ